MTTYGEDRVHQLVKKLPNDYYGFQEPHLPGSKNAYQNPDYVIVCARMGVVVVEIKDYKHIAEINTDTIQVFNEDGTVREDRSPLRIARDYGLNLQKRFQQFDDLMHVHHRKRKLKFPWASVVVFTHMDKVFVRNGEKEGLWEPGSVLCKDDLASPEAFEEALKRIPWTFPIETLIDDPTLNTIQAAIKPSMIVKDSKGGVQGVVTVAQAIEIERLPKTISPKKRQTGQLQDLFSKEVEALAEQTNVRLVRGVAGSGKSLILARRAEFLAENYPEARILVTTYNKELMHDLQGRIAQRPNTQVTNFHKLCRDIIGRQWQSPIETEKWLESHAANLVQATGLPVDYVAHEIEWRKELEIYDSEAYLVQDRRGRGQSLNQEKRKLINHLFTDYMQHINQHQAMDWGDVPRVALNTLQRGHVMRHSYDFILIDEAQDFAPSWLEVIKRLLKPDGHLFMCDDPTQSLFRSFSWKEKGVEVVGRSRVLRVPFRCTREIMTAAYALIDSNVRNGVSEEIIQPDLETYTLNSGPQPLLVQCNDWRDESAMVEALARQWIDSGINPTSIAVLVHSSKQVHQWADLHNRMGLFVSSFRQMKGLEFDAVIIPNVNTILDHIGNQERDSLVAETKRKLYTAMTRARQQLALFYYNTLPAELSVLKSNVLAMSSRELRQQTG
ncbi:MAG TPA: UvrD-helicase domain-containing protein [Aggregatilineales bacterium]|nr:UvrD-helicase domain-containing protein [Aggregatilineales bacterium]